MAKALKVQNISATPALIKPVEGKELRIDLACGDNKRADGEWLGIDKFKTASTDYTFDLLEFPWPIADGTVDAYSCAHFFEHVPKEKRGPFMDEVYRTLKVGAQILIVTPHYNSMRAIQDFTHEWPPIAETSFLYFNAEWRRQNKLTHGAYALKCDFDFGYGHQLDPDVQLRNHEFQVFAVKHYTNAALDLHVTLTKRG